MRLDDFISIPDQGRVVDAIGEAEKMTSGEIRVHITPKCGNDVMKDAAKTFDRLKMYKTRHRNGVLIYVAFESRKFAILGDAGINLIDASVDGGLSTLKEAAEVDVATSGVHHDVADLCLVGGSAVE